MRAKTHRSAGAAIGTVSALMTLEENAKPVHALVELVGGAMGGAMTSVLPDRLEPATSPHHRSVAHSFATAYAVGKAAKPRVSRYQATFRARADEYAARRHQPGVDLLHQLLYFLAEIGFRLAAGAVAALAPGYLSHLALDATTPKGLPLLAARLV